MPEFPIGTKFKLVTVELLVPSRDDSYMDALSDLRDDHPELLLEWDPIKCKDGIPADEARKILLHMNSSTSVEDPAT